MERFFLSDVIIDDGYIKFYVTPKLGEGDCYLSGLFPPTFRTIHSQVSIDLYKIHHYDDLCGVCNGYNTTCLDCAGVINGDKEFDECGVCDGDNTSCADCSGTPNGEGFTNCSGILIISLICSSLIILGYS